LITRFKNITSEGAILEVVVWKVPAPVPPTEHGYKYSAVYVVDIWMVWRCPTRL